MRITIDHREQPAYIFGVLRNYYVDCTIQFSEEEKAIIQRRGLHEHVLKLQPPTPPPTFSEFMLAGILQAFSPLVTMFGFCLLAYAFFESRDHEARIAMLLIVVGPIAWSVGYLRDRAMRYRMEMKEQYVPIRSLRISKFTVGAQDPVHARVIEDHIREQLHGLKSNIIGSAEMPERQTFEL